MKNLFSKFILPFLLAVPIGVGLFGSITTLFIVFCVLLPSVKSLIVPNTKVDPIMLAAIYKWMTISVIVAALAGGILMLSMMGVWLDFRKWWKETSAANPSAARRRLVTGIIIAILTLIVVSISFIAGKNGW
ncbi:MAG TPA: hypothetical protein VHG71_04235 [Verrucomicrobiae bacterium]|nr:hypothetical protein [Verrucomicrobiae bacterium]